MGFHSSSSELRTVGPLPQEQRNRFPIFTLKPLSVAVNQMRGGLRLVIDLDYVRRPIGRGVVLTVDQNGDAVAAFGAFIREDQ